MIVNAILYLSSAWYSIYHLIFFLSLSCSIGLLRKITKIIENIFSLIFVLPKIWYFCQLRKIMKVRYLRWAFLRKCCFSCSVGEHWKNWCSLAGIYFVFKNWLPPSFNNNFHQQEKLGIKQYCFQLIKNLFPLARKSVFIS